jgi:regulator of protease activity HflC (stomatin/prohibitin superfamily)
LKIVGVGFQDVHPPVAVLDAYRDVSRAGSDRLRRAKEGAAYRVEALAAARGRAAATVNRAEAERVSRVARSAGEADAFRYVAAARAGSPALTDHRLYWEAVGEALAGRPKVILDPGKARPRHLIVPDLVPPEGTGTAVRPELLGETKKP